MGTPIFDQEVLVDWKAELIKQLDELMPADFIEEKAQFEIPMLIPWAEQFAFLKAIACVNRYPIAWVGPGYLMLTGANALRTPDNEAKGTLFFTLSRGVKFNGQLKIYNGVDFLSL
jgi:hypothetical protein